MVVNGSINRQSAATRAVARTLCLRGVKLNLQDFYLVSKLWYSHRSLLIPMFQNNVFWLFICGRVRRANHEASRGKGAVMQIWLSSTVTVLDIIMHLL